MTVVVYLTYVDEGKDVSQILRDLGRKGAQVTFITAPEGGAAAMHAQEGQSLWSWLSNSKPVRIQYAGFVSVPTCGGSRLFILVRGDNLIRHDTFVRCRLSPGVCQVLSPVDILSPMMLEEWNVSYLVEPKDSLALHMPTDVLKDGSSSTEAMYLMLEFWRATIFICALKFSTADIMLAVGNQAVQSASRAQMSAKFDLRSYVPASSGRTAVPQWENASQIPSRAYQLKRWGWDVFVGHAAEDRPFARLLCKQLLVLGLRCFADEDDLHVDDNAASAMEAAMRSTHVAVLLLSEQFFTRKAPLQELRWFLDGCSRDRNKLVPVFLGISVERCLELAKPVGCEAVCDFAGVRHALERQALTGVPVLLEVTMQQIIKTVRDITGV